MNEAAVEAPKPIHATGTNASGVILSRGYHAVGPSGQLVLMRPGVPLKPGWRFATQADIDAAEQLEARRRAKDKSGEHEERSKLATAGAKKRAAVEGGDRDPQVDGLTNP